MTKPVNDKPANGKLASKNAPKEEPKEEDDDEDNEDEDNEEGDDDDDVPIAKLVKKKESVEKPRKPKSAPASAAKAPKKKAGGEREKTFYESKRGAIVQALLRRWWYAIEWPSKECKEKKPEACFETLPAFPGVHICTSGDRIGDIVDHRDHSKAPSFKMLYTKPSEELKKLLVTAYQNQIDALIEAEGEGVGYASELRKEMALALKINVDKSDADAIKAVRAYDRAER
ncbi:hypothetical protein M885DRAFT_531339 [Pelagophyceae sp. CCMP2097]|nr:hypothetical protein M885DRAFT_531339 [Pelagophyceae sp. CCMP2097]|mmetsp:Transcript_26661/g.89719  ORF Transcript_26661/g.89719 Transcript_26661/m.89719 type:complete len:229 (-) Transcript_26661:136-822(-)